MSSFQDDDILKEFILECREHLDTIENDLLLVENQPLESVTDLVNKVFRAAHSIKGGAGFLGLQTIKELAHKTENVLDRVRSGDIATSPEVINILLQAFDQLKELINDSSNSESVDVSLLLTSLTQLLSENLDKEEQEALQESVEVGSEDGSWRIEVNKYDLEQSSRQGYYVYLVRLDLIGDIHSRGKRPYDLIKEINSAGSILASRINISAVGTLDDEPGKELPLEMLYATIVGPEFIDGLFDGIPAENIHLVTDPHNPEIRVPPEPENASSTPVSQSSQEPEPAAGQSPHGETPPPISDLETTSLSPSDTPMYQQEKLPDTAKPHHAHVTRQPKKERELGESVKVEETLRVSVPLLEELMNLAGELVLSRNQLLEAIRLKDHQLVETSSSRINSVSSELQETIMRTRMQPVGNVFSKLPRLVRDLCSKNGKDIQLEVSGGEVEMDKAIIEGIGDPLIHMVRNSADHGIEAPEDRGALNKPEQGVISVTAKHQAGQVVLEVADDGKGMDPEAIAQSAVRKGKITAEAAEALSDREKLNLVFLPGLSTANQITDVSGRGVGMDVVKTNIDRLGGHIDIDSKVGTGTIFKVNLPLTLAIMPSLLVAATEQLFAIPQSHVRELIRIPADEISSRIESVSNRKAITIRDQLIPVVYLPDVLNPDGCPLPEERTLNLVIIQTSNLTYGLFVDALRDTEEIVVRPLGMHVKGCQEFSGATILGNGQVAMILDATGLARKARLNALDDTEEARKLEQALRKQQEASDAMQLLCFNNRDNEPCALPLHQIRRIERVTAEQIDNLGGVRTMTYRKSQLPLVCLSDVAQVNEIDLNDRLIVLVMKTSGGKEFGLLGSLPVDVVREDVQIDPHHQQTGITGSMQLNGRTTLLLNLEQIAPHWNETPANNPALSEGSRHTEDSDRASSRPAHILLVEDSEFFRKQLGSLLKQEGFQVTAAEDGRQGLECLKNAAGTVDLVLTDVEMPHMSGLEMTKKIRELPELDDLPIIAVTTLADEDDIDRGKAAGVTEYQIKLDPDQLLTAIYQNLQLTAV